MGPPEARLPRPVAWRTVAPPVVGTLLAAVSIWSGTAWAAGLGLIAATIAAMFALRAEERLRSGVRAIIDAQRAAATGVIPALHDDADLARLARYVRSLSAAPRSRTPVAPPAVKPELTRSGLYAMEQARTGPASDSSPSGVLTTADMVNRLDPRSLRWLQSTPAEQSFLERTLDQLRALSFPEIVHVSQRDRAWRELQEALSKGEAHGLVYLVKTGRGQWRAIEMDVGVRYGVDGRAVHLRCHVTDVTPKLRAERAVRRRTKELARANTALERMNRELEELKDRYTDLYQNAPVMYFSLANEGTILDCNETMARALGRTREELIGRPYAELVAPEKRALFPARQAEFLVKGRIEVENRWQRRDGSGIEVLVVASAVRDRSGAVIASRSVAQDITERKRLEAELLANHERLARTVAELSHKNKELDEFTYVVSHDLQEPVRSLIAFSDFLQADFAEGLGEQGREYLRYVSGAAKRMRALIHDLLVLSRAGRSVGAFREVAFGDVVRQATADLAELCRCKGAEVRVNGELPRAWGDPDRLVQVVENLIANGIKYNTSEAPVIEVWGTTGPGTVTLHVRDNGIGIEPAHHAKVFQLFRRLHAREEEDGSGAGLAICQRIAQAHGGRITLTSQLGQGSTFSLQVPSSGEALLVGVGVGPPT